MRLLCPFRMLFILEGGARHAGCVKCRLAKIYILRIIYPGWQRRRNWDAPPAGIVLEVD